MFPRLQGAPMGDNVCSVDFASQEAWLLIFNQQQIDLESFLRKPGLWIRRIRNRLAPWIRIRYSVITDPDPYHLSKIKEISENQHFKILKCPEEGYESGINWLPGLDPEKYGSKDSGSDRNNYGSTAVPKTRYEPDEGPQKVNRAGRARFYLRWLKMAHRYIYGIRQIKHTMQTTATVVGQGSPNRLYFSLKSSCNVSCRLVHCPVFKAVYPAE